MLTFNDTKLLRHPTVERAFAAMRGLIGMDDDVMALSAVATGELITQYAKQPDPDAVAASVLLGGMVVRYKADSFAEYVSPQAAEYLERLLDFDPKNPKAETRGEQQVLLAMSMRGLEQVKGEIAKDYIDYRELSQILKNNESSLKKIIRNPLEPELAEIALTRFVEAQDALNARVTAKRAELAFENTGLPDHPLVKKVFTHMRDWNLKQHPMGGYCETNRDIAKALIGAGVQDPEMIAAALLNQYSGKVDMAKQFSPRVADLYAETSAWASLGSSAPKPQPTPDGETVRHAARLYFLGSMLRGYESYTGKKGFDKTEATLMLERIEDMRDSLSNGIPAEQSPEIRRQMQYIVSHADGIMNMPKNAKIRKPGSPKLDMGW